jgi:hypothetical protein
MKLRLIVLTSLLALCASPVLAQGGAANSITYNGFSFSFDPALASSVTITPYPGDPIDLQAPGGPEVRHTEFILYHDLPVPSAFEAPAAIRVYRTADFAGYEYPAQRLDQLQQLLAGRPDLGQYMVVSGNMNENTLPFMPVLPAAQAIRARAHYVDTGAVRGIGYVTTYRQSVMPFVSGEFFYTFQGLSTDGAYYISAMFRVTAPFFPAEIGPDFDMDAFMAALPDYFAQSIAQLNQAAPTDFSPSLDALDAVIQSFAFSADH